MLLNNILNSKPCGKNLIFSAMLNGSVQLIVLCIKNGGSDCVVDFLAGFNNELDGVRGRTIGRDPLPSTQEVFSKVKREESRQQVMLQKPSISAPSPPSGDASALLSKYIDRHSNALPKTERRGDRWCDYCNRSGHTRNHCWKLHGKPANFQHNKSGRDNKGLNVVSEVSSSTRPTD